MRRYHMSCQQKAVKRHTFEPTTNFETHTHKDALHIQIFCITHSHGLKTSIYIDYPTIKASINEI